jgi:putative SOS response-associated peptidase YedK
LPPRWNIAPSQDIPAVRLDRHGKRRLVRLRWGLIPYWAKDPKIGYRTINARAETVATAPAFREAFQRRRCLIPAENSRRSVLHLRAASIFSKIGAQEAQDQQTEG